MIYIYTFVIMFSDWIMGYGVSGISDSGKVEFVFVMFVIIRLDFILLLLQYKATKAVFESDLWNEHCTHVRA